MESVMLNKSFGIILFVSLLALTGCRSPDIYHWGRYEDAVYGMYAKPDKNPPEMQLKILLEDLHKAEKLNKPVPPGFHAHLGYLYVQAGQVDFGRQQFLLEKQQFPEAATFIDRLVNNLANK